MAKLVLVAAAAPSLIRRPHFPYGLERKTVEEIIAGILSDRPQMLRRFGHMFFFQQTSPAFLDWFFQLGLQAAGWATAAIAKTWIMWRRLLVCPTKEPDDFICVKINLSSNRQRMPDKVTYKLIQQYVEEHYGFKVHTAYVAEVKRKLGLPTYPAPNAVARRKYRYYSVPQYKEEAIIDALKYFKVIDLTP